jgi:hypothetical protein
MILLQPFDTTSTQSRHIGKTHSWWNPHVWIPPIYLGCVKLLLYVVIFHILEWESLCEGGLTC